MRLRTFFLAGACVAGFALALPAQALNILLTNDDGYAHPNLRALLRVLRADGHTVKVSAPWADQSGVAGAVYFLRETTVGHDEDPAYPEVYYLKTTQSGVCASPACRGQAIDIEVTGTPVMAAVYGIERVLPQADLVISGPNVGNNLGEINSLSGTFNAAATTVRRGVPSLAVSADLQEPDPEAIARAVAGFVRALEAQRKGNAPLLPPGVGLNLNFPRSDSIKGVKLTRIGSWISFGLAYSNDLGNFKPALAGKPGVGFRYAPAPAPSEVDSEGVWIQQGYVTVSPFSGLPAAPAPAVSATLQPGLEAALTAAFAGLAKAAPAK